MRKVLVIIICMLVLVILTYGLSGYIAAARDADNLKIQAVTLAANGYSADRLGNERLALLLRVQDPGYYNHSGLDLKTDGAGLTTVTQSLSKRLAFKTFKPGIGKIRQTGYALSLEKRLDKSDILALFLDTVPMGHGPDGWVDGFFQASDVFYGKPVSEITDTQFIELVSVLIAPGKLNPLTRSDAFNERVKRIERLYKGECQPDGNRDVWLDACAAATDKLE